MKSILLYTNPFLSVQFLPPNIFNKHTNALRFLDFIKESAKVRLRRNYCLYLLLVYLG